MRVTPAILERDFREIKKKLDFFLKLKRNHKLDFSTIQIDFCDGVFVENKTWLPGLKQKQKEILKNFSKKIDIEYHLMCKDQKKYFLRAIELGAKSIVVHIDDLLKDEKKKTLTSLDFYHMLGHAMKYNFRFVLSARLDLILKDKIKFFSFLNNYASVDISNSQMFKTYLDLGVQIMGIKEIGRQGQAFDKDCLEIIKGVKNIFSYNKDFLVQVDGAINEETADLVKKAGANSLVVGSFLVKKMDEEKFVKNYKILSKI